MKKIVLFSAIALMILAIAMSGCTVGEAVKKSAAPIKEVKATSCDADGICEITNGFVNGGLIVSELKNNKIPGSNICADSTGRLFQCKTFSEDSCGQLVTTVKGAWGSKCGDSEYNRHADINSDGAVDTADWSLLAVNVQNGQWCEEQMGRTTNVCNKTDSMMDSCLHLLIVLKGAWASNCTSPEYNRHADIDNDGRVSSGDWGVFTGNMNNAQWCEGQLGKRTTVCS